MLRFGFETVSFGIGSCIHFTTTPLLLSVKIALKLERTSSSLPHVGHSSLVRVLLNSAFSNDLLVTFAPSNFTSICFDVIL